MEWVYDKTGRCELIFDDDCFKNSRGEVVAWINDDKVYSRGGRHKGWFDDGVFYDLKNSPLGFLNNAKGNTPLRPIPCVPPVLPIPSIRPIRPVLSIPCIKPIQSMGWSTGALTTYFNM